MAEGEISGEARQRFANDEARRRAGVLKQRKDAKIFKDPKV